MKLEANELNDLPLESAQDPVQVMLERVYALCAEDKPRHGLREIFRTLYQFLLDGQFEKIKQALDSVDLSKIATTCAIGFLSITHMVREDERIAPTRAEYVVRVREHLTRKEGAERTQKLLQGLA